MLQRVQKIMANAGICSRRQAESFIKRGKVKVNGKVVGIGGKADPFKDNIIVDGRHVRRPERIYIAFNKPPDCLTTLHDPKGRKTILHYIKLKQRVIPVGRLDFNTQGLLLLTNDGDFANRVMHPRYEVEKTYMIFLDKKFAFEDARKVKRGLHLGDTITRPAKVEYVSPARDVIEVSLHQGQNRVVRRMMTTLGYRVKRLIRTKVGNLLLGSLPQAKYRRLTNKEVKDFMDSSL
jgi:23S rRNA pseudouridine2605 synthase